MNCNQATLNLIFRWRIRRLVLPWPVPNFQNYLFKLEKCKGGNVTECFSNFTRWKTQQWARIRRPSAVRIAIEPERNATKRAVKDCRGRVSTTQRSTNIGPTPRRSCRLWLWGRTPYVAGELHFKRFASFTKRCRWKMQMTGNQGNRLSKFPRRWQR